MGRDMSYMLEDFMRCRAASLHLHFTSAAVQCRASNVQIWRLLLLLLLFSLYILQLIASLWSERRVLLQRRFNKSTTFWWLCCSVSCVCTFKRFSVCECACLGISGLLSFSPCMNVGAWFLDLLWHLILLFKGRLKAGNNNVEYLYMLKGHSTIFTSQGQFTSQWDCHSDCV